MWNNFIILQHPVNPLMHLILIGDEMTAPISLLKHENKDALILESRTLDMVTVLMPFKVNRSYAR